MVNLTGITAGPMETQTLQVTAASSDTGLIPNPTVTYTSPNATGTLTYKPVADKSGTAIVTVTVKDAGLDGNLGTADDGMVSQSFTVTVTPVNDAPTIKAPVQVATKQDVELHLHGGHGQRDLRERHRQRPGDGRTSDSWTNGPQDPGDLDRWHAGRRDRDGQQFRRGDGHRFRGRRQ